MKAARALARFLPDDPATIAAGIQTFKDQTGRAPTLQEITSLSNAGKLRGLVDSVPEISEAAISADQASTAARPASMAAKISDTGPVFSSEQVRNALEARAAKDFQVVREKGNIPLEKDARDLLEKEILPQMGNLGRAKREIVDQLADDGSITGANLDLMRKRLGQLAYAKPGEGYYELKQDLLSTIGEHVPELKNAVQNYADGMQALEGIQHGENILGGDSGANYVARLKALSPLGQQSAALGARSTLLSTVTGREGSAERLAGRLATDGDLRTRLGAVLGPDAAEMLNALGTTETNASRASARVTPSVPSTSPDTANMASDFAHVGVGMARAGAGDLRGAAYHLAWLPKQLNRFVQIPPGARKLLAIWLADPNKADAAIAYLKKAGVSDQALRKLMAPVAATATQALGSEAGAVTGQ
jgi:hypothetical protein